MLYNIICSNIFNSLQIIKKFLNINICCITGRIMYRPLEFNFLYNGINKISLFKIEYNDYNNYLRLNIYIGPYRIKLKYN